MSAAAPPSKPTGQHRERAQPSDLPFLICFGILGGSYLVLIVAMLAADVFYAVVRRGPDGQFLGLTLEHLIRALASEQIRYAIKLSLIACSMTAILSLWVAVPLGYLLSRMRFPGKWLVDSILDIPIVLPPLVVGLSLLILFQTPVSRLVSEHVGFALAYLVLPGLAALMVFGLMRFVYPFAWPLSLAACLLAGLATLILLGSTPWGGAIERFGQQYLVFKVTYAVPSVILAQFSVAAAFAVRTMRVTFDQISPRTEQVALTLGCTRSQAFWMVVLPDARRGVLTAATLAWARALGEFGPILVFSGATRMKTEVLSTTVFLELSIGDLEAAVAVSLLMVLAALVVLVIVRRFGQRGTDVF